MYNTCVTSSISLRTRGTFSFELNDYAHCLNERYPFACSSSRTCCSCCANYICKVPVSSSYCCNLYGLRQSSLIHRSPYRKLISGGLDRLYYARLPFCDVDDSCYFDEVFNSRKISVGGRKGRLRKSMVFEERSEGYDAGGFDEAEDLLSLLTEDISEESFLATKEIIRLREKPVVEKPGNAEVDKKCGSKKKRFVAHVLESEPRYGYGSVSSSKNDNRRREEIIRRKEEKEGLLRKANQKGISEEKHKDAWLTNQTAREKEEEEALLRKVGQKDRGKREREFNWKLTSKTEDREDLLRREEHRQKVSKDASSCSSYYSFSSAGDYESENDTELRKGRYLGESLRSHKRNSKSNEMVYPEAREEDHKHEDYRDHGVILTKKSTENYYSARSSVVESDFRKKSEKKLADVTVQEMESRGEALQQESKLSMAHESNYKKSSDYYVSYDDRKAKSSGKTNYDEERKQQQRQTGNEIPQQTETRMKHKQFVEMPNSPGGDVINSYGSQNIYSGKDEMTAKVASSSQATVGERQRVVGLCTREDEYQRNSHMFAKLSEIQDIDIRKTSISQQRFESCVKEEDYSANILSSINDAAKQQQCDQISGQVESRGKSQQLTKKEGNSISKRLADELIKQEENVNLAYGSSSQPKIIKSDISKKVYDELTKTSLTHSGDSGAIDVEGRNKTQSDTAGALSLRLNVGIATNEVSDGSLQIGSTSVHEHNLEGSTSLRHETYGRANSSSSHGQHSKFISHEDAIRSAAQLEKSSTQYIGEYFDQIRNEISSSEILREKRTNETRFVHEEQHHQHNLVQHRSEDSQSKEHESRSDGQHSGAKGPSDEMWNVEEPSVQELSRREVQDDANKDGKSIVKRSGRSLWNIISDIVLLRWAPHSGSHSSGRKTGGRSSPNQSTSSEAWFSGHEAVESEEVTEEKAQRSILQVATEEKEQRSITQGLSESNQAGKIRSQIEEGSSSSTFRGQLKQEGINVPSSSDVLQSQPIRTSLHSGGLISEGNFGGTSTSATPESSISLPAFQLQRSPAGIGVSKAGEVSASDSGMSEQLNTGLIVKKESAVNEGELKQRTFQRQDQVIKDRFDEWENAYRLEAELRKIDEKFMREALLEAQKAADNWEVPVGAVLVHNGKIIARGCNLVEEMRDSTAHAEMICIKEASNMLHTWRLSETTLYVTLEPCPMCAGAILQARIDIVVWGAPNKLLGADGSWIRLFPSGDGGNGLELTDKPAAPVHPFHPNITIRRGVLSSECADAMQQFFKLRRKKDKKPEPRPSPPSCLPITHRPSKFLAKMHDAFNFMFCL